MTTRRELEKLVMLLMKKAKAKYGTLEMISWKTGISTKSLRRYAKGDVLPSLEAYAILCECIGGRCYSEKSGSDFLFRGSSIDRTGLSNLLKKIKCAVIINITIQRKMFYGKGWIKKNKM